MGNEQSTHAPPTKHEEIIKIVNANVQQTEHLERTADATTKLAYIGFAILVMFVLYVMHRVITKYERLRTNQVIRSATSLANVTVSN